MLWILLFFLLFSFVTIKNIKLSIFLTVFLLPTYLIRFKIGFIPMTLLELMILITFFVWLINVIRNKSWKKVEFSNYKWLTIIFLVVSALAIFVADNKLAALGVYKAFFIEPVLFSIVLINEFKRKEDWKYIYYVLGGSALLVSVPAIIQHFTGASFGYPDWQIDYAGRVVSWYGFPNALGLFLGPIVIIFAGIILMKNSKFKILNPKLEIRIWSLEFIFNLLVIFCSLFAIIFAQSEGAIVGIAAGLVVLGLLWPNRKLKIATLTLIILGCITLITVQPVQKIFVEKATLMDLSGQIRRAVWGDTMRMLEEGRIITGAGLANYQTAVAPYTQRGIFYNDGTVPDFQKKVVFNDEFRQKVWQPYEVYLYPHNIILNFWSETGLYGLILVVLLLIRFGANYFLVKDEENKKYYIILLVAMVAILVHGLVDVPYFKNDLSVIWWMIFSFSWVLI